MNDPMAMATAMMAFKAQAEGWIASTKEALAAAGQGFTPEDVAAISASAAANPLPSGYAAGATSSPEDIAAAQDMARRAMEAVYPPEGFAPDDPRIQPVEGVDLAMLAIAAKAIGWSTDAVHTDRVVAALGIDRATWDRAAPVLQQRVADDVVLAAFYGQLYAAA